MTLSLPRFPEPELSVLMVTHGSWPLTKRALGALVRNTHVPYEVIVVDNDSQDETRSRLAELTNLHVMFNDENKGFGAAVNQAAARARGEYLLLLNSDAFVHPGWWPPMRDALNEPTVGAVVPQLLHEDGSLQDAGPLLARDGTVRIYGDGGDPAAPCYRFRRVLDFGPAACLLISGSTFTALGGFDPLFDPAYYEDADLGLRLSEAGRRTIYEPRAKVTHVRYGSGSVERAVNLSERNRQRFVARWHGKLTGRPPTFVGATEQSEIAARDVLSTPRVLVCGSVDHEGVDALVEMVSTLWPDSRLTWATGLTSSDDRRAAGVEVLDEPDWTWLERRLFHYDLIFLASSVDPALLLACQRTQPQAPIVFTPHIAGWPDLTASALLSVAAEAGIAPQLRRA
jgi:GT2 family glycosyltransferase